MAKKAKKLMKSQQKDMNCQGKKGEADRHVFDLKPKPIFLWQENVRNKRSQIKALIDEVGAVFSVIQLLSELYTFHWSKSENKCLPFSELSFIILR